MVRIGQRLKEERLTKGLSVDEVAKATKIRPQFITAIEAGRFKQLPSKAYAQGFVKNYIAYLELPMRESIAMFRREFDEREYVDVLPESFTKQRKIPLHRINWYRTALGVVVIFLILAGFLVFQYRAALFSPYLVVTQPKENAVVASQNVSVTGSADANTTIVIDNAVADIDSNGHFAKIIPVFPGKATIVIVAVNKFGKRTVIQRHITVQ